MHASLPAVCCRAFRLLRWRTRFPRLRISQCGGDPRAENDRARRDGANPNITVDDDANWEFCVINTPRRELLSQSEALLAWLLTRDPGFIKWAAFNEPGGRQTCRATKLRLEIKADSDDERNSLSELSRFMSRFRSRCNQTTPLELEITAVL